MHNNKTVFLLNGIFYLIYITNLVFFSTEQMKSFRIPKSQSNTDADKSNTRKLVE